MGDLQNTLEISARWSNGISGSGGEGEACRTLQQQHHKNSLAVILIIIMVVVNVVVGALE